MTVGAERVSHEPESIEGPGRPETSADPATATPREHVRSPLAYAAFRAVWLAAIVSFIGSFVQDVGQTWVMLDLTKSPLPSAMLSTAYVLASLVTMLPAGVIADRRERRNLVVLSQLVQAGAALVVGVLAWTGHVSPAVLLVGSAMLGLGTAIGSPAWQALVPEMLPREVVAEGIALNAVAFNVARAVGPALGGVIVAHLGAAAAFLANAVSFLGVVGALYLHPPPPRRALSRPPPPLSRAMNEPFAAATADAQLRAITIAMLLFTLGGSCNYALAPAFGKTTLGAGAGRYGIMIGAMGAGAVLMAVLLRPLRARLSPRAFVSAAMLTYAASGLMLARVHDLATATLLFIPAGMGWLGTFSSLQALLQLAAPDRLRARLFALYNVAHLAAWALGATAGGAIAERIGIRTALLTGASMCALGAFATMRLPLPTWLGRPELSQQRA